LPAGIFAGYHKSVLDCRESSECRFHLGGFDRLAEDLDSEIFAPQVLEAAIGAEPSSIAGPVETPTSR
jgi:hypothetical protein